MPGFFFRPVDLASLALLLVATMKTWRLWRLRPATPASRWLAMAAVCLAAFAALSILISARLDAWGFYAIHLRVVSIALGALATVQYTYHIGGLDPTGKRARGALIANLLTLAYIVGWAFIQIRNFNITGEQLLGLLPSRLLLGGWILWAMVVTFRQARVVQKTRSNVPSMNYLLTLIVAEALFIGANVSSYTSTPNPGLANSDIVPVYLVAIAVILISFNFLLYSDTEHSRFNRLVAVSLLALQSVFTLIAVVFGWQVNANLPAVLPSAGEAFYRYRAAVNDWIEPLFLFQFAVSLLAIIFMSWLEGRMGALDKLKLEKTLSRRQLDIVQLVAQGRSNSEIGTALSITESTVKYHLTRMFQLLEIDDRQGLADWYRESSSAQD